MGVLGSDNEFTISQFGDVNSAHLVNFNGLGNDVNLTQLGEENIAVVESSYPDVSLTSNENDIEITQDGLQNETMVTLAGILDSNFNQIDIAQNGDFNLIDMMVEGSGHSIDISQEGENNWVVGTEQSPFLVGGENVTFNVTQLGNDNIVEGGVIGVNSTVTVTQIGDGNTATITQM